MLGTNADALALVWSNAQHLLTNHSYNSRVHRPGPAAALARLSELLYCKLESNYTMVNPDGLILDLAQMSRPEIIDFLLTTWSHVITTEALKRKTWQDIDTVDVTHTHTAFQIQELSDKQRALVKRHLTGAFQNTVVQIHWKPKAEVTCILCGVEQPSLLHDQLDCTKLEQVRVTWQEWLAQLSLGRRP